MSTFENRRWLIIPSSLVSSINFNEVLENDPNSLRFSVDGTKTFIKYEVRVVEQSYETSIINAETGQEQTITIEAGVYGRPSIYSESYPELTHTQMLELLSTSEWTMPMPIEE